VVPEEKSDGTPEGGAVPLTGVVRDTFEGLGLNEGLTEVCAEVGYEHPTEIQQQAIPLAIGGQDLIGQAKTGTGKTAAFVLPALQRVQPGSELPRLLVLEPTRELALQVAGEFRRLSAHMPGWNTVEVYGGASLDKQVRELRQRPTAVVGTPGRVMDLMGRNALDLSQVHVLVLDEASRMLDMGFIADIEWILEHVPKDRQTLLFSATMPGDISALARKYMHDPVYLRVSTDDDMTVGATEQTYYRVGRKNKMWALSKILDEDQPDLTIIFCNTKIAVDMVARRLRELGYSAGELHGDMRQTKRENVVEKFREASVKILVASDVAARGLDIEGTSHVINYDIPEEPESYVHRIGRTSRMGRKGKAITFVTTQELHLLEAIEMWASTKIELKTLESSRRDRLRKLEDYDELANMFGMVTFELDLGESDGARLLDVVELVKRQTRLPEQLIGHVEVGEKTSRVEIDKSVADSALSSLKSTRYNGRKVWVEVIAPDLRTERQDRDVPPGLMDLPPI
jgi:ATP-dependent RNA helicase DeaD